MGSLFVGYLGCNFRNILLIAVLLLQIANLGKQRSFCIFYDTIFKRDSKPEVFFSIKVNQQLCGVDACRFAVPFNELVKGFIVLEYCA